MFVTIFYIHKQVLDWDYYDSTSIKLGTEEGKKTQKFVGYEYEEL